MNATPPAEFSSIGLHGNFIKAGAHEWHGECPRCGGRDRFVIFTDRQFPSWNWFCRKCHPQWGWIDELNTQFRQSIPPEKLLEYARQREESLRREIERAQEMLKELQRAQVWMKYHAQLTQEAAQLWQRRGIPPEFQEIWGLGYDPDRVIVCNGQQYHTPTLTIPIFEPVTRNVTNIRHRLLNPPAPGDKYRPERSGLPAPMFVADPDVELSGRTLIVEGEIKGMVSYITADDPGLQVIGVPGKNMADWMYARLAKCEPIYVCFDPDATREARATAAKLGKERTRLIELPDKIDDMILRSRLDKFWVRGVLAQAVKL